MMMQSTMMLESGKQVVMRFPLRMLLDFKFCSMGLKINQ